MKKALILTDIQNDFVPGGALAVPKGDEIVPVANRLIPDYDLVVATQDWHPANHKSFANRHPGKNVGDIIELGGLEQVLWPDHCVQGTHGAELVEGLNKKRIDKIIHKGTDPNIDSYSTFFDNEHRKSTGLDKYLKEQSVDEVYIMGLATDYCVKYSVLDSINLGFKTYIILEGCRGIDMNPGDCEKAINEMKQAGAIVINQRHEKTCRF
jgi:nicotinamidase/pyrazinamidase